MVLLKITTQNPVVSAFYNRFNRLLSDIGNHIQFITSNIKYNKTEPLVNKCVSVSKPV